MAVRPCFSFPLKLFKGALDEKTPFETINIRIEPKVFKLGHFLPLFSFIYYY